MKNNSKKLIVLALVAVAIGFCASVASGAGFGFSVYSFLMALVLFYTPYWMRIEKLGPGKKVIISVLVCGLGFTTILLLYGMGREAVTFLTVAGIIHLAGLIMIDVFKLGKTEPPSDT